MWNLFGKKKKVKHAERHVDYKVSSENLAMPELHIGEDKGEEQPEKKKVSRAIYKREEYCRINRFQSVENFFCFMKLSQFSSGAFLKHALVR